MAFEVRMPQLGLTMEEGTVTKWLKQEGDAVKTGDVILEITTDKLTSEVESEHDGVLLKIVAQEGKDIPVKGLLAYIGEAREQLGSAENASVSTPEPMAVTTVTPAVVPIHIKGNRIKISPLAKKTAAKLGVDYTGLIGSGSMGRIVQKDILVAAEQKHMVSIQPVTNIASEKDTTASTVALMDGDEVVTLTGMRKVVAERMTKSAQEIPTVTQNMKIDVTELIAFRNKINKDLGVKYSLNDYILKATAKALKQNKHMLVSLDGDKIIKRAHINIGMAVALDDGLIVPVIKDADKMSLGEISEKAREIAERARTNKLTMEEYQGSTFSISNLGMFGIETFDPIINQPDAGILGICTVSDELAMDDAEKIIKKQVMRISYTLDHRLVDGATAAKFQLDIKELLENPIQILL